MFSAYAQDYRDEVLITIDGKEITAGEFERVYKKNNNENVAQKQTVEEYLDMFINYKLKVIEAEELGMDTASSFLKEFNSYKKQLAQPYLTSEELTEKYAKQAYERMKEEINASHIMVRVDEEAAPEDTLYAYNKIMEIRKRVMNGEDFETVARATSDDPSAKTNGGHLAWFSAFRMVYPFETAAYNTEVGEVSMPVRSNFGYHIINVHDRRPSKGSVHVAHIFIRAPESMSAEEAAKAKEKMYMIYDSLKMGANFSKMADRYSDDKSTGRKGGVLPWFSSGQMIPAFDTTAFALKEPGDISEPVKSSYGWHLIKLLEKKNVGSYEDEKPEIISNIKKGDRGKAKDRAFINQLKDEYGYEFYPENYDKFLSSLDSTVFDAKWTPEKAKALYDLPLFTIGDKDFNIKDFANYFSERQLNRKPIDYSILVAPNYDRFEESMILGYEEDRLEDKYPEFKNIVQEYHDGILLFDLTDQMVWSKAVEDSAGLEAYYEDHKNNYMWDQRALTYDIIVIDSTLSSTDVFKDTRKLIKRNRFEPDKLMDKYCENDTTGKCLEITENKYEKGDNERVDGLRWKEGSGQVYSHNGDPALVIIAGILEPSVKKLEETRGLVISDYQKHLEEQWMNELRNKYDIEVNRELLSKIND